MVINYGNSACFLFGEKEKYEKKTKDEKIQFMDIDSKITSGNSFTISFTFQMSISQSDDATRAAVSGKEGGGAPY